MIELFRTNDLVLISRVEAILAERGIGIFVADSHMSAVEGSLGFLPRRVLVGAAFLSRARRALREEGLGPEALGDKALGDGAPGEDSRDG